MAQPLVPLNVCTAARLGNYVLVEEWLVNGGDANLNLAPEFFEEEASVYAYGVAAPHHQLGCRLLSYAAEWGRLEVVRVLLAHGADVNYVHRYGWNGEPEESTALLLAVEGARGGKPIVVGDHHDVVSLLIQKGADCVPIMKYAVLYHDLLRMALAAGVDLSVPSCYGRTPENCARYQYENWRDVNEPMADRYAASVAILEGTRLAGSYKNYVKNHGLREFKELLRLRSLLARGRARIGPDTPEAAARLFGARAARTRPPTRRHPAPPRGSQGVPDPVFWKVVEYWRLGDWRRPRWRRPPPEKRCGACGHRGGAADFSAVQWAMASDWSRRCKRCRPPHLDAANSFCSADPDPTTN